MNKVYCLILVLFLSGCNSKNIDYASLKSFDNQNNLHAVIEIPVGSNAKIEYQPKQNIFQQDTLNGKPRVIQFLGYPVNYGFIPSTLMDKDKQGDGDPIDVLVLGKRLATGQMVSVKPIGLLQMIDGDELDHKILGIPIEDQYKTVDIENFKDLSENHYAIRSMIGEWFLNYDKSAKIKILGWSDENRAIEEVRKWQILETN